VDHLLEVQGLKKSYQSGSPVLQDVNLSFKPGEFAVILGLSGAGKSTFLRCLNRLIEPTSGEIRVARAAIYPGQEGSLDIAKASHRDLRLWRRKVGMIFQQFNLVKRLSVLDNVLSGSLGYAGLFKGTFRFFSQAERERALYNLERVGHQVGLDQEA